MGQLVSSQIFFTYPLQNNTFQHEWQLCIVSILPPNQQCPSNERKLLYQVDVFQPLSSAVSLHDTLLMARLYSVNVHYNCHQHCHSSHTGSACTSHSHSWQQQNEHNLLQGKINGKFTQDIICQFLFTAPML